MTGITEKIRRSIFSILFAVFLARSISFAAQIVLARLLVPKDFGLMAIALMLIYSFNLLQHMGINDALVVQKERNREAGDTAFLLILLFGFGMAVLIYSGAPIISSFFNTDREILTEMIRVLVLVLIFNSLHSVPNILIEKELEFEKKFLIEIVPAVGYAAAASALAYSGYGVWSLVYGRVFSALITIPIVWKISSFRPTFGFDMPMARTLLSYGKFIALGAGASFIVANIDDIIVGKVLDFTFLGFYAMAFTISNLVVVNIAQVINRVSFPVYSRISDKPNDLKKMLLLTVRYISMIAAPFSMVLITMGHELIRILLGEKWLPMVPALQIICVSSFFRALFSNAGPFFNGVGKPRYIFFINSIQIVLLLVFLVPMTIFFKITGTAMGMLVVTSIIGIILFRMINKIVDLKLTHLFSNIFPSVILSFLVGLLNILWIDVLSPLTGFDGLSFIPIMLTLILSIALFFLFFYIFNRQVILEMLAFIKGEVSSQ